MSISKEYIKKLKASFAPQNISDGLGNLRDLLKESLGDQVVAAESHHGFVEEDDEFFGEELELPDIDE